MSKKTLLIVDDELVFCDEITLLLRELPCNIIASSSGNEALGIIESQSIDVVLSDIMMPDGNGLWLLDQLIDKGIRPSTFCFHSADPTISRKEIIARGADEFFAKILDVNKLKEWLQLRLVQDV